MLKQMIDLPKQRLLFISVGNEQEWTGLVRSARLANTFLWKRMRKRVSAIMT